MEYILKAENIYKSIGGRPILEDVSLGLVRGEVLGIVGESGSGKSTLARVLTGLLEADSGRVLISAPCAGTYPSPEIRPGSCADREEPSVLSGKRSRGNLRRIQMVFQDPESSLNPRKRIGQILSEPMSFHFDHVAAMEQSRAAAGSPGKSPGMEPSRGMTASARRELIRSRCRYLTDRLELPEDTLTRYPGSFSGGQKQRIALARALSVYPDILIADEPTSALDVSVQFQLLKLLKEIQRDTGLSIIFISHDLGVIRYISSRVAVMNSGHIEEVSASEDFFSAPQSACGKALLSAASWRRMSAGSP